ncbi:MAG: TerD family protein, partial [Mycobacteriaceae bacterium]
MAIDYTKKPKPQQTHTAGPAVNLSKVTLTKASPTVSLTKGNAVQGDMKVNLNWSAQAPSGGFFAKISGKGSVDLDLGCLYELADGTKGVVQALGGTFGVLENKPFIRLDADDRTGALAGGENMFINLRNPQVFKRILIFAMIYEGAPNWAAVDGVVTLFPTGGPQVEVKLDEADGSARICAIALLQNQGGDIVVNREVRYIAG